MFDQKYTTENGRARVKYQGNDAYLFNLLPQQPMNSRKSKFTFCKLRDNITISNGEDKTEWRKK